MRLGDHGSVDPGHGGERWEVTGVRPCRSGARRRDRDGVGARRRDARKRHGPVGGRGKENGARRGVEREDEFLGAGGLDGGGKLLLGGFFRGGDAEAHLAGFRGIEGGGEGFAERKRAGVFSEHFAPCEDLHGVQQRAVGAEPGEEEAGDGEFFPQGAGGWRGGEVTRKIRFVTSWL